MDDFSLWVIFGFTTLIIVGTIELGYLIGRAARRRSDNEKESPVSAITGTVLALMAFILAFTFGIVADRYDARRALVREQAASIRTAYLRSDFLPEASRLESQDLYRTYLDTLVQISIARNFDALPAAINELKDIESQLWELAVANVRAGDNSDISALYVESINEMSNVLATRITIVIESRLPDDLWVMLYLLLALAMVTVGYQTAIADSKRTWMLVVLALSFSLVVVLIAELDDPERGLIAVSQEPLIELQAEMT